MQTRKALSAAAFVAVLAGGGVAGALLGSPITSGAQSEDPTTTTTAPADGAERPDRPTNPLMEAAADALGISVDDLFAELRDGKTIAEVAEAKGVELQTVIDAMVAAEKDRLADLESSATDRITDIVNGEGHFGKGGPGMGGPGMGGPGMGGPGGGHGGPGMGGPGMGRGFGGEAAAEAIGITTDELHTALRDGKTIAEVAQDNGVEPQTVIDAMVAEATTHIDEAVADGKLTEEQAAKAKERLTESITTMVNEGFKGRGPGHGGPPPGSEEEGD